MLALPAPASDSLVRPTQVSGPRPTTHAGNVHLVYTLAALAESLADLCEAQDRLHQARAARHAAGAASRLPAALRSGSGLDNGRTAGPAARPAVPSSDRRGRQR